MSVPNREEPQPNEDPLAGTKYRALRLLGEGGMGEVYSAEHVELGRKMVVKLLHSSRGQHPEHIDRMRLESQALARLSHPNIVSVTDAGATPGGRPFVVMERLRGKTLHVEIHKRRTLPLAEALEIIRSILGALAAAHDLGIVHRDIKPANIFLHQPAEGPRVLKLLDFGLAKVLDDAPPGAPAPLAQPTRAGAVLGTSSHLSPEQALGQPVDARSDLYSVGVILYRMITGRAPFEEEGYKLVAAHARQKAEPPSRFCKEPIPPELDHAVLKALAKKPDQRFQSAREFADALGLILDAWSQPASWSPTLAYDGSEFAGPVPDYIKEKFPFLAQPTTASGEALVPQPNPASDTKKSEGKAGADEPDADVPAGPLAKATSAASTSDDPERKLSALTEMSPKPRAAVIFAVSVLITAAAVAALVAWVVAR